MPDLSTLKPGAPVKGAVVARFPFGALVDIGIPGVEGFVHELDLPSRSGPSPLVSINRGQTVMAWVLDANPQTRRVALTLVNPASLLRMADLREGQRLEGVVTSRVEFGAFVDVGAEKEGLLHNSEIERAARRGVAPGLVAGARIAVYVQRVDPQARELGLRLLERPRLKLNEITPGVALTGHVTGIQSYGAFMDIDAEENGMVHVSEMASGYVANPATVVQLGQAVKVRVKSVDLGTRKISLTMK
jgi:transcriptional accessory protein Tex/SPT6